jgi:hypothetical protein
MIHKIIKNQATFNRLAKALIENTGQNFSGSHPFALTLMLLVAVLPFLYLKKKHVL